jgi:hypothetical protein
VNDNQISVHWSDLPKDELTRFCQDVDAGTQGNFLIAPVKKLTRRKRGEHSTKAKCENPAWYRPEHYKKLSGQLGHAYNRLVKKDKETGQVSLRIISRHPLYVAGRRKADVNMASVRNVSACSMRSGQCSSASVMPASIPSACVSPVLQKNSVQRTQKAMSFLKRR